MESTIPKIKNQQEKRKEKERIERLTKAGLKKDYADVFGSPAGIRVLNDILTMTHQFQTSFSFQGNNQIEFREGERNIGLFIIKKMTEASQTALFKAFKTNLTKEYSNE